MAQHGRYTVVRKLAKGGMAEIFLASQQGHEGFQKPVVLKRILSGIYSDPQFRNMLIDEAHISMSLTHSNIVQVLDLGLAGGRYFLVLELVDGWDLGQVLQRGKLAGMPLPANLGIFIVTEICRALAYAHAKRGADGEPLGIVHRDVSPNNVLISEHGEVKLADFGIAKAMKKREHTGTGVVKGKVAFMSPEQALGKPIDRRSDVFSLGTLLYVVTVGRRPFEASTDLEILLRVQNAELTSPVRVRPDLAPELVAIITRAMQLSPQDRYQSAEDMLLDLERVLRGLFGGVGQTELKQYLAELGRRDAIPPISRASPLVDADEPGGDPDLVEGNAVVLADARGGSSSSGRTDLAELMAVAGDSEPGYPRRTVDLGRIASSDLIQGQEPTPPRVSRRLVEELPLADVDAAHDLPPARYRRNKSRLLPTLFVLALVGAGLFVGFEYLGWSEKIRGGGEPAAADVVPVLVPAPAPRPGSPSAAIAPAARRPIVAPTTPAAAGGGSRAASRPSPGSVATVAPADRAAGASTAAPTDVATTAIAERAAVSAATAPAATRHPTGAARGPSARPERTGGKPRGPSASDVFRESGKRVRSLSQGIDQLPPGTITIVPPAAPATAGDSPPASPPTPPTP